MMEETTYRYHFNNISAERLKCGGFALYQYGELWCLANSRIGRHTQCCYELTYVLAGSGTVRTGSLEHRVRANDCVVSLPDEIHSRRTVKIRCGLPSLRSSAIRGILPARICSMRSGDCSATRNRAVCRCGTGAR